MAWMVDEYEKVTGEYAPGVFTGKPVEFGGSLAELKLLDTVLLLWQKLLLRSLTSTSREQELLSRDSETLEATLYLYAHRLGAKLFAISDIFCTVYNEDGIDIERMFKDPVKPIKNDNYGTEITKEEFFALELDALIPCALENQITSANAGSIKAKVVCEGANGPTTPEADAILAENNVLLVPDILANAGGVTVSYFEWVQNLQRFSWTFEDVQNKQEGLMYKAFDDIWKLMDEPRLT